MTSSSANSTITGDVFSLSHLMKELGPSCTSSNETITKLFEDFQKISENEIMDVLLMIAANFEGDEEK